jgi:hypothetical protein
MHEELDAGGEEPGFGSAMVASKSLARRRLRPILPRQAWDEGEVALDHPSARHYLEALRRVGSPCAGACPGAGHEAANLKLMSRPYGTQAPYHPLLSEKTRRWRPPSILEEYRNDIGGETT